MACLRWSLPVVIVALVLLAPPPDILAGANIVVTETEDENNADGDCSLREAIRSAELNVVTDGCPAGGATDTITLAADTYDIVDSHIGSTTSFTIQGQGVGQTVIRGDGDNRLFSFIGKDAAVRLNDLTLADGFLNGLINGGAIYNQGTLSILRASIVDNSAGFVGGAIYNGQGADLSVNESTLYGNVARGGKGGAAIFNSGNATVRDSTISANGDAAEGSNGGAITNSEGATLIVERSLFADNTTDLANDDTLDYLGGAIDNEGTASFTNVTFSGNTAGFGGAIVNEASGTLMLTNVTAYNNRHEVGGGDFDAFRNAGTMQARNTIVLGGGSGAAGDVKVVEHNCGGDNAIVSLGGNIETGTSCGFDQPSDRQHTNPLLGTLADNGGLTETHAILAGSPAIDRGALAGCPDDDQRGQPRPQGNGCDAGAYESAFSATPTPEPTPTPTAKPVEFIMGDVDCDGDVDAVDSLKLLRSVAGLEYEQEPGCVPIGGEPPLWGDVDCDGDVDTVDALWVQRHIASLPVQQVEPCTDVGDPILV